MRMGENDSVPSQITILLSVGWSLVVAGPFFMHLHCAAQTHQISL